MLKIGLVAFFVSLAPSALAAPPDVGTTYFAYGTQQATTAFVSCYHMAQIRSRVQAQLAALAAAGTTTVRLPVWFVADPSAPLAIVEKWMFHFPPTALELSNLLQYAKDVHAVGLQFEMVFGWIGCSDYHPGTPPDPGACPSIPNMTVLFSKINQTVDAVTTALASGGPLSPVSRMYLDIEVSVSFYPGTAAFLTATWPHFQTEVAAIGALPTIYFASPDHAVSSAAWLASQGLTVPAQLEFSLYPATTIDGAIVGLRPYSLAVTSMLAGILAAGYTNLGVAETLYPTNAAERAELGAAIQAHPEIKRVFIWPTSPDPNSAYRDVPPFDLSAY